VRHRVRRHADVERDILDIAAWIGRDSRDSAFRFLEAVEQSIDNLRRMPGGGSPKQVRGSRFAGLRSWAVRGFPNHIILYEIRPRREVYIFAVVHGSRRYLRLLRERSE
jgi:toxin ParE1/3/4